VAFATAQARAVSGHLDAVAEELCTLLEQLVRVESPSDDFGSQSGVLRILAGELQQAGFRTRQFRGRESGGYLVGVPRNRRRGAPFQLLIGHGDTVWPHGTLDAMPLTRREGRLAGPGSYDMKGGLTTLIYALKSLAALGLEPAVTPVVLINSDEEVGSPDSRRPITRLARSADRALILEPAAGRRGRLKTARKGMSKYTIRVRGKAAHAGTEPERGVSAILELSHIVQRLFDLNDAKRGISVNVGTIAGGSRPNVVAAEAQAIVDVRAVTRQQADEIDTAIRHLSPSNPRVRMEVEGGIDSAPMERTSRNRRLWKVAQASARELGFELKETLAGGGSDGNTTSLYTATLDGLGPRGGGAHAAHEFVAIDSLVERCALLALLILAPPVGVEG
jgi:glutamate carboxypeptidase